ncbi:MAG: response regulator transcription factor [Bacteroidia bacterium]|nr:response regulator transcription factor [Bacteroidia bacterium]
MTKPLRTIIIEDETLARQRLEKLLIPFHEQVTVVGVANNGQEGLALIETHQPDFIFLDIQMPVMNGLEMLMKLDKQPFVVFTTAYDQYALESFEQNSIDYLLKPIQPERLAKTIQKLLDITQYQQQSPPQLDQVHKLLIELQKPKTLEVIRANVGDRIVIIKVDGIQYFKAEDKLTTVVTAEEKEYYINPSLSTLLPKLPANFIQISRSVIVNEEHVLEIRKSFNRKLTFEMKNKEKFLVGTTFLAALKERWSF